MLRSTKCSRLVIAICLLAGPACGQDFNRLLQAVDKLEARLQTQLETESQARGEAVASLEFQLKALKAKDLSDSEDPDLAEWKTQVSALRDEVADIKRQIAALGEETELASVQLVSEIEYLRAELAHLGEAPEDNPPLLASTELIAVEPTNAEPTTPLMRSAQAENSPAWAAGLALSGFVDASNFDNHNTGEASFGLDQFELDLVKDFSGQASLNVDVEYVNDGFGAFDFDVEQGYLTYSFGHRQTWALSFGKFNAPIGFELLDAPDMYQYSHALVFENGLPTNLTGIMMSTEFPKLIDWTVYIVNGWDVNTDNNKDKTVGTRVGFTPAANLSWGISAISGPETDGNNSSRRTVVDFDLTWEVNATWMIGAEYNYGTEGKAIDTDADGGLDGSGRWSGFLVMSHVAMGDRFGLTTRVDLFNDENGLRTGTAQTWKSFCLSPSVSIVDGLGGLVELRYDWSDAEVFAGRDGTPKDNQLWSAVEFTYGF